MTKVLRIEATGVMGEVDIVGGSGSPPTSVLATFTDGRATFAHSGALTSQRIVICQDGTADDAEMDPLILSAYVSATNTIIVRANLCNGKNFSGEARVNYSIG